MKRVKFGDLLIYSEFWINGTKYKKASSSHGVIVGDRDLEVDCSYDKLVEVESDEKYL